MKALNQLVGWGIPEISGKNFMISRLVTIVFLVLTSSLSAQNPSISDQAGKEAYRPRFHFTPLTGWMNDPNGMVYYDGEYHLFYQFYPDSTVWGPMHWGHAVSKDLVHWERLPVALYPDSLGYIFSGSAVMDLNNTSGLGTKEEPAMVAVYTYHNLKLERMGKDDYQYQAIAYSLDKGRTWTKYANNPVVKNPGMRDFRDPKVSWNAAAGKWIMVLAAGDKVMFYSSPDLLNWTFESDFGKDAGAHGGVWECPDLFPMQVGNETKWILIVNINPGGPNGGSAAQYFAGDFDGHRFIPSHKETKWIDYGKDNYAGVTWSNIPDDRTLFIGWMSNWQYGEKVPTRLWRSANTFPRELKLIREGREYTLVSRPVKELQLLKIDSVKVTNVTVEKLKDLSEKIKGKISASEISVTFQLPSDTSLYPKDFGLILRNSLKEEVKVGYDFRKGRIYFDRSNSGKTDFSKDFPVSITAPCSLLGQEFTMNLLVDEASMELFAQEGRIVMTNIFFPGKEYDKLLIFTNGRSVKIKELKFTGLKSIW